MRYSAGIMSYSFWYLETRTTAKYMVNGLSKSEISNLAINENIYQVGSERRSKELLNVTYRRLKDFPIELLEYFLNSNSDMGKIFVLISVLKTDRLFFEFMHEVFREHILIGNHLILNTEFDSFFINKAYQSELIENWKDTTIMKLKAVYKNFLSEAGLLKKVDEGFEIITPILDVELKSLLEKDNLQPFINVITGEN